MGMKIKLDDIGSLFINDRGVCCPFVKSKDYERDFEFPNNIQRECGDWCALFGEPGPKILGNNVESIEWMQLQLCHKTLYCKNKDFEDLREK